MMRAIGFDHVIDYRKEHSARNGRGSDLILDTKTTRSPFAYTRSLSPGGTYATVGGDLVPTVPVCDFRVVHSANHRQTVRLIMLKQNHCGAGTHNGKVVITMV
jgi:NADPH:quinone reductase-like Zn-dependent oxidoreductase